MRVAADPGAGVGGARDSGPWKFTALQRGPGCSAGPFGRSFVQHHRCPLTDEPQRKGNGEVRETAMYRRAHAPFLVLGLCLVALTSSAAARDKERSPFAGKFSGEWTF